MAGPDLKVVNNSKDAVVTLTRFHYEQALQRAYAQGCNHGQERTIYYLHVVMKGYLRPEHFERNDASDSTWEKMKQIVGRLIEVKGN